MLTIEDLRKIENVYDAIQYSQEFYPKYVLPPKKPRLKKDHFSDDAEKYAKDLKEYEIKYEEWEKDDNQIKEKTIEINTIVIEYIKEAAGFESIPNKSKDKVWSKAWVDGHSAGFYKVYLELCELVDLF